MSFTVTGSPLTALRALRDAARHTPGNAYTVTVTAVIPPGRHPRVSGGEVTGRLTVMGSLLTIHHAATLRMIEDIRPEWVTSVEIV